METYSSKTKKGLSISQVMMESKLSGGSGRNSEMVKLAIDIASKHQIDLEVGHKLISNKADGNCLYQSVMDNVSSRKCFGEKLKRTPEYYRKEWNQKGQDNIKNSDWYPYICLLYTSPSPRDS